MSNYNFQEFNSVGGRILPSISLGKSGGFGVSAGFIKKYEPGNVVGVKLFFDKEKMAVGFKFLKKSEEGMMKIKMAPKQGGGHISAQAFLIKFDLESKKYSGKYTPKEDPLPNGDKMFVIELKQKTE